MFWKKGPEKRIPFHDYFQPFKKAEIRTWDKFEKYFTEDVGTIKQFCWVCEKHHTLHTFPRRVYIIIYVKSVECDEVFQDDEVCYIIQEKTDCTVVIKGAFHRLFSIAACATLNVSSKANF